MSKAKGLRVDLHNNGLLWLINRSVFHPRGHALGHTPGTDQFTLVGNGLEPWRFASAADLIASGGDPANAVDEDASYRAAESIFAQARMLDEG